MKIFELFYNGFDNLENREPYYSKSLGVFKSLKKANEALLTESKKNKKYKGWDGETYPKFKIEEKQLK